MTSIRRVALLLIAAFALLALAPGIKARENETFGLTPYPEQADGADRQRFSIPLEPGATFEDAVRIYNRTDQPLDLLIYAADAEQTIDATDITADFRTEKPRGVGAWIDLNRETIELAPRDEVIVSFRVEVKDSEPKPELGAIVVENTAGPGTATQRVFIPVSTEPPNTETSSIRVRPLLLRSPWIIVAILGLVVAAALVFIGARRAKRPKDVLVPAGEIEQPELEPDDVQTATRPVIKRLGASGEDRPLIEDAFVVEVELPGDDVTDHGVVDDEDYDEEADYDVDAEEDDEDEAYDEEDVDEEEDEDEADLPPARKRPARPAAKKATAVARSKPKAAKKKPKPKPKPKASVKKKKAPARKRAPVRKAKPKPKAKKPESRGYIPLKEL
jgi:hypothetical protein